MQILLQIAILIAVFVTVVTLTLWGAQRVTVALNVGRRLRADGAAPDGLRPTGVVKSQGVNNPLLGWIQASTSIKDEADRSKLRRALALAGFDSPSAPAIFVLLRLTLSIGLPFIFLASLMIAPPEGAMGPLLVIVSLFLCAVGLILPQAVVDRLGTARKEALEHQFPDALDLMVVCVEAGLGLESAFVRVAHEVQESHPRIAQEFKMVSDELRAGRTRAEALRNLGERSDVAALRSFSALLIQTDALGTSIAQTLRTYSQEMREHRFLRAEEKAMRIPVLMTIPLVGFILPVIITSLMLPAIIEVMRTLLPALEGAAR